ncbi:GNAT family N-acetyltransferase [Paenibacillus sp. M1]|uniref:GNAT family N-acetyltransferase n=1 Tax=Paenibacillus haidiansis TaxID=1574488 RepID=A0ABU7VPN3_9BACL
MLKDFKIERISSVGEHIDGLSELLVDVVDGGASLGFLPPLKRSNAAEYWGHVHQPEVLLWIARSKDRIVGTVQLHLCTKENGLHRAEIAKLMTAPDYRRKGLGRSLMQTAEMHARQEARNLIVLDTRDGDPSNLLYESLGYMKGGTIPRFAKSADGKLDATNLYYKCLD